MSDGRVGDTPLHVGVAGHVDTSMQADPDVQGDTIGTPGSPILPQHHVDKSNDPPLTTAGDLRRLGYSGVPSDLPDDAVVWQYASDAHVDLPPAPEAPGTGDTQLSPSGEGTSEGGSEEEGSDSTGEDGEEAAAEDGEGEPTPEEVATSAEFAQGRAARAAGADRRAPYDGRSRQAREWNAGYDSSEG